jgi:hypothetical protein
MIKIALLFNVCFNSSQNSLIDRYPRRHKNAKLENLISKGAHLAILLKAERASFRIEL